MDFLEFILTAKKNGYEITEKDINFAILCEMLNNNKDAYSLTHKQILKPKKNTIAAASNLYRTQKQIYIRQNIQTYINDKIKAKQIMLNPEIILSEIDYNKGVTTIQLRDYLLKILQNTKNSVEIYQVVKLLIDKFELDDSENKQNKHIIILPAKSDGICPVCHTEL